MTDSDPSLLAGLRDLVGSGRVLVEDTDLAPYETDWRNRYRGRAVCAVLPRSAEEVAGVVRLCSAAGVAVVPQGGRTNLVGAAVPEAGSRAVVLNLSRMNRVRGIDPVAMTLVVDAGVPLATARERAAAVQLNLPILIGSEGSAQIGGVLATNAGGSNVLRYGMTRNHVMGLEVVLPDGRIWNGMRPLAKDNTGYALRQLFIGSEGTLGIITGAILQLVPERARVLTAFCPVVDVDAALRLLEKLRRLHPDSLVAFEYLSAATVALIAEQRPALASALAITPKAGDCLLVEFADVVGTTETEDAIQESLAAAIESGWITDALVGASESQRKAIWAFREAISLAQEDAGYSIKNDVSVPIARIPDLLRLGTAAVAAVATRKRARSATAISATATSTSTSARPAARIPTHCGSVRRRSSQHSTRSCTASTAAFPPNTASGRPSEPHWPNSAPAPSWT